MKYFYTQFPVFSILAYFLLISPGNISATETVGETEILLPSSGKPNARKIPVTIYTPPGKIIRGNILLLPGWKHSRYRWLKETGIKVQADLHHFRLICPEMDLSIYASQYFPETTLKWAETPGLKWIHDFLLPAIAEKGFLKPKQNNFVLGLSTGGRGAALVTLDNPDFFNAAASLSGDFDQTKMPEDKLMTAVYGNIKTFPERWQIDNPVRMAQKWTTPLYLAHGTKDLVVPTEQTKLFYTVLHNLHPALDVRISMPEAGHDYVFWDSQVINVMNFFEKYVKKVD